jgi:hypothetical protein
MPDISPIEYVSDASKIAAGVFIKALVAPVNVVSDYVGKPVEKKANAILDSRTTSLKDIKL